MRFACEDNWRVIRATDNYIEKYLPFKVQNMISLNLKQTLSKTYKALKGPAFYDKTKWTAKQLRDFETFTKFKTQEYEIYREMHKIVLRDDGEPSLKKTAF